MKKFSAILICLLMIVTCSLAGCAGFSINKVKYYNEVLAVVDETKITRYDLLSAYSSYGNSYFVQQQGQSEEQALKSTLDLLIDRELMYQYALDNQNSITEYKPTAYQVNEIINEMFESMDSQMDSYIEKAKTILNIETEEDTEAESKDEGTAYKLEDYLYTRRAFVKYGDNGYYIEYNLETLKEETTYNCSLGEENRPYLTDFNNSNMVEVIKDAYFDKLERDLKQDETDNAMALYRKVREMFASDLMDYEYYLRDANGKAYDKVNENLFSRYFDRTFKNQIKSQYLENVRTYYLTHEELDIELLESEYKYLAELNYNTYSNDESSYKSKMKDIGTAGDTVVYHPVCEDGTQFGYFIHTLISFDSISDKLALADEIKDEDERELQRNLVIKDLAIKPRNAETGLVDEDAEAVALVDILDEYEAIKNATYATEQEKISAFLNFMFKYTGDTATLSAGMPYVVGTNGYSAMEQAFTDEAVLLMTGKDAEGKIVGTGKPGNMSKTDYTNINNMCVTSYGIHLIYYIGDVNSYDININETDKVYIQSDDIAGSENYNLYNKIINPLTKETYFDMMFDLVYPADTNEVFSSNNGYTDFEEEITTASMKSHPVTKYTDKINATKTSI